MPGPVLAQDDREQEEAAVVHHPPHVDGAGCRWFEPGPGVDGATIRISAMLNACADVRICLTRAAPDDPLAPRVRPARTTAKGAEAAEPRRLQQGVQCALDVVRHHHLQRRSAQKGEPPGRCHPGGRCAAGGASGALAGGDGQRREALDTLLVALLTRRCSMRLRLGRVDERAFDRRGDDRDAARALELADEWQQRGLAHLAGHVDLAEEQHLWSPVLRVERNLLELFEERLPCAVVAQPTQSRRPTVPTLCGTQCTCRGSRRG